MADKEAKHPMVPTVTVIPENGRITIEFPAGAEIARVRAAMHLIGHSLRCAEEAGVTGRELPSVLTTGRLIVEALESRSPPNRKEP